MSIELTCPYCDSSNIKLIRGSRVRIYSEGIDDWGEKTYIVNCINCNEGFEIRKEWRRKEAEVKQEILESDFF